jgi:hypothetical protein
VWVLAVAACGSEGGCRTGAFGAIVGILAAVAIVLFVGFLLFTRRGRERLRFLLALLKLGG